MDFEFSGLIGPFSAAAAALSAYIAYQSNRHAAQADRQRRVREVSLLANKVVAGTVRVDDLGNQLKMAYQTLFAFAGQGAGGGRLELYTNEIQEKQTATGLMQTAALAVLDSDLPGLSDDEIAKHMLDFDGYLAHLDRVKEKFHVDLASVEAQNQMYRQDRIKLVGPGA